MSRTLLQQALEKYLSKEMPAGTEICDPLWWASRIAKELERELAKPEQAPIPFPSFMRKRIEEAIDAAINPTGMSVHDGKATVYASDLQRMIAVIDLEPPRKPWQGLTYLKEKNGVS
jgi:hypothetical protein